MELILYFIFAYGLSNVLVYGYGPFGIVEWFRNFCSKYIPTIGAMLECMMCTSTNIGIVMSLVNLFLIKDVEFTPANCVFNDLPWYMILLFDMFATSGAVWLIHTLQEHFEKGEGE